jgi:hypothetical protein
MRCDPAGVWKLRFLFLSIPTLIFFSVVELLENLVVASASTQSESERQRKVDTSLRAVRLVNLLCFLSNLSTLRFVRDLFFFFFFLILREKSSSTETRKFRSHPATK